MAKVEKTIRVGLILSNPVKIADYSVNVGENVCKVLFHDGVATNLKVCDIVLTDKAPNDLTAALNQYKDCHETAVILNTISNPLLESGYESTFTKANAIKYRSNIDITAEAILKIINSEIIKVQLKNDRFDSFSLLINKNTRGDLFRKILSLSWLLLPFLLIVLYLLVKYILKNQGYNISFLCWFVKYEPDCNSDFFEELKLLALLYSIFNFKFYYDYILSIFDNINNDVFQFENTNRKLHKGLQFFTPVALFLSALIIFKALFVFKYSFDIASEYGFINIASILDSKLPFLKDDYLIFYFLIIDGLLWLMTRNFSRTAAKITTPFSSNRQQKIVKEAQKSFKVSFLWDLGVVILSYTLLNFIFTDSQSKLALQLVILQFAYLGINISIIFRDFKYN